MQLQCRSPLPSQVLQTNGIHATSFSSNSCRTELGWSPLPIYLQKTAVSPDASSTNRENINTTTKCWRTQNWIWMITWPISISSLLFFSYCCSSLKYHSCKINSNDNILSWLLWLCPWIAPGNVPQHHWSHQYCWTSRVVPDTVSACANQHYAKHFPVVSMG